MKNILIIIAPLVFFLWLMGCMMDSAIADVTGAGSTTNDQVTSGSSSSNTAITGGYHSESSTTYATGASSNTTTNNETNNNSYTGDTRTVILLMHQHSATCRKTFVLLVLALVALVFLFLQALVLTKET